MSQSPPQPPYLVLTLLFLFLTLTGVGLMSWFKVTPQFPPMPAPEPTPTLAPAVVPTVVTIPQVLPLPSATVSAFPSTASGSTSPIVTVTPKPTLKLSVTPMISPLLSPVPTPQTLIYKNDLAGFTVTYSSSRKVYEDKEKTTISRFTFYRSDSSFAIHLGPDWSWSHPTRVFTPDVKVSTFPSFRYESSGQVLVDLETNDQKITLQCVHNNIPSIQTECEEFITSFRYN